MFYAKYLRAVVPRHVKFFYECCQQ